MRSICNIREFSKNEEHPSIKNEIFPNPIYQKGKSSSIYRDLSRTAPLV